MLSLRAHLRLANLLESGTVPCPLLFQSSHVACSTTGECLGRPSEARKCTFLGGHLLRGWSLPGLPGIAVCGLRPLAKAGQDSSSLTVSQLYESNHSYFLETTRVPKHLFLFFSFPSPVRNGAGHHSCLGRTDCAGLQSFLHVNPDALVST